MMTHSRSWSAITVLAFVALMIIILISTHARAAGPWYVAPGGNDGNSCLSAGSPCATINGAIGKASPGDTIYVATGTYASSAGDEVVLLNKSVTLSGGWDIAFTNQSGASTIDGQEARRGVTVNSGVTANIERFIIQNGSAGNGGGIYNIGTTNLISSTISDNLLGSMTVGGGVSNVGTMTVTSSIVNNNNSYYSGGIHNHGIMIILNSIVSGNSSDSGAGGILNDGTLTINGSSISGNHALVEGGGISNHGVMILTNTTVSSNTAGMYGGGIYNANTLHLSSITIASNITDADGGSSGDGGGISNSGGTVNIRNTIIAGNSDNSSVGTIHPDCSGILISEGNNLIQNTTGCVIGSNTTSSLIWMDLMLGRLPDNDSPILYNGTVSDDSDLDIYKNIVRKTFQNGTMAGNTVIKTGPDYSSTISSAVYNLIGNTTGCTLNSTADDLLNTNPQLFALVGSPGYHPLLPWSPAINAGNPAGCTDNLGNPLNTDQRGVARVGRCDIGAYEYDPNNDPLAYVFLPLISKIRWGGIYGLVTLNGNPIAGVSLNLWFYNGSDWSFLATTTTGADGYYAFLNAPGLGAGQKYFVYYSNTDGTPGRLWFWRTPELTSYSAGSAVAIGDFDIADIALVYPDDGATVSLPITFQWTLRPTTPSDNYKLRLYDPTDENLPWILWTVGYVNNFTLGSLPLIFSPGVQYAWEIRVDSPDGGFGVSYDWRYVTFSNSGLSSTGVLQPTQPKTVPDLEYRRKR